MLQPATIVGIYTYIVLHANRNLDKKIEMGNFLIGFGMAWQITFGTPPKVRIRCDKISSTSMISGDEVKIFAKYHKPKKSHFLASSQIIIFPNYTKKWWVFFHQEKSCSVWLPGFCLGFPYQGIPSLKLTAKAPENVWLEYFLLSYWEVPPISRGF